MIKLRARGMKAATIVALSFLFAGVGVTAASATQPDFICEAYDSGKIDTTGDPATVEVTAPEGMLISGYCVKAGIEKVFVVVDPPQKTVIVDHPTKDSVSHYALQYVNVPDKPADDVAYGEWVDGEYECDATEVSTSRSVSTTTYKWMDDEWVAQTPVVTVENSSRELTADEMAANVCPEEKPDDIVVVGEWVDGEYECDATEVATTRETSTTTYTLVDDEWVAQTPVVTVENSSRELTADEMAANVCPEEKPDDIVVVGEWVDGEYECDATEVATTRETSTTTYTLVDDEWVAQTPVVTVENSSRELTADEMAANVCPVDIELAEVEYAPTWTPICLPNNDTVDFPDPEVAGVTYTDTGWVLGQRTITASADEGYTLLGETSWTFTDTPAAECPDETGFSGTPKGELAYTGALSSTHGLTALAIFLMATGTMLVGLKTRAVK